MVNERLEDGCILAGSVLVLPVVLVLAVILILCLALALPYIIMGALILAFVAGARRVIRNAALPSTLPAGAKPAEEYKPIMITVNGKQVPLGVFISSIILSIVITILLIPIVLAVVLVAPWKATLTVISFLIIYGRVCSARSLGRSLAKSE